MVEGIGCDGVDPITRAIKAQEAILPLNGSAIGDIDPFPRDVLHLQLHLYGRNTVW
ncbi:hypothetical protein D3C85_1465310 [compost metagenome]